MFYSQKLSKGFKSKKHNKKCRRKNKKQSLCSSTTFGKNGFFCASKQREETQVSRYPNKFCIYLPPGRAGRYIRSNEEVFVKGLYSDAITCCVFIVLISLDRSKVSFICANTVTSEELIISEIDWVGNDCEKVIINSRQNLMEQEILDKVFKTESYKLQFRSINLSKQVCSVGVLEGQLKFYQYDFLDCLNREFYIIAHPLQYFIYNIYEFNRVNYLCSDILYPTLPSELKPPLSFNPLVFDGKAWCCPGLHETELWPPARTYLDTLQQYGRCEAYEDGLSTFAERIFDEVKFKEDMLRSWNFIASESSSQKSGESETIADQILIDKINDMYLLRLTQIMIMMEDVMETSQYQFKKDIFRTLLEYQEEFVSGSSEALYYTNIASLIGQNSQNSFVRVEGLIKRAERDETIEENSCFNQFLFRMKQYIKEYHIKIYCDEGNKDYRLEQYYPSTKHDRVLLQNALLQKSPSLDCFNHQQIKQEDVLPRSEKQSEEDTKSQRKIVRSNQGIQLQKSTPLIWYYQWLYFEQSCLEKQITQIKLEMINDVGRSNIGVNLGEDRIMAHDGHCCNYCSCKCTVM